MYPDFRDESPAMRDIRGRIGEVADWEVVKIIQDAAAEVGLRMMRTAGEKVELTEEEKARLPY